MVTGRIEDQRRLRPSFSLIYVSAVAAPTNTKTVIPTHAMNTNTIIKGSGATQVYQRKVRELIDATFGAQWAHEGEGLLLDIGCGDGHWTRIASDAFESSIGIDKSGREFPETVKESNIEYLEQDFLASEFQPETKFDGIISILVFELVHDPITAARKAADLLSTGGRILLVLPNLHSPHMWMMRRSNQKSQTPFVWNGVSFTELVRNFELAGLRKISSGTFGKLPPDVHLPPRNIWIVGSRPLARVAELIPLPGSYRFVIFENPALSDAK